MMQFTTRIPERAFGVASDKTVLGFKRNEQAYGKLQAIDPKHRFDARFFEEFALWWQWEDTRAPLLLTGPTGCGKTSGVLQFLARVNAPTIELTCHPRMDKSELLGGYAPGRAGFQWVDGPAALAWRHGLTLVINEFTLAPSEVWVSANDLLGGDSLYLTKTAESIARHPNTRVVLTDNGAWAEGEGYFGRNREDASVIDRCWHVRLTYLSREDELALLKDSFREECSPDLTAILEAGVRFAQKSRETNEHVLTHSVSTRVLERFLSIYLKLRQRSSDALERALALALASGLAPEAQAYLQQLAHFEFAGIA